MNKIIVFLFLLINSSLLGAKEYQFNNYEIASSSYEFLKFESESTKLGIFTTDFDGYAKKYEVNFKRNKKYIEDISVVIESSSFDTDNSSRDEKMNEKILHSEKFETITFSSKNKINLEVLEQEITGNLVVRGVGQNIILKVVIEHSNESISIKGRTTISLKKFKIPDPSIAIASVRDEFDLSFRVKISE